MSVNHIANREKLINFLIADNVGPLTSIEDLKFEKIDTTKEINFEDKEDSYKLFCDKKTGEEILHMRDIGFNPLKAYSAGILFPPESIIDENIENDEIDEIDDFLVE